MASFVKNNRCACSNTNIRVTRVGVLANTSDPEPVSSDITPNQAVEVVEANWERFPDLSYFNARSVLSAIVPSLSQKIYVLGRCVCIHEETFVNVLWHSKVLSSRESIT